MSGELPTAPSRSWPGRILGTAMGLAVVAGLIHLVSGGVVLAALHRAAAWLPLVFLLEGGMLACETCALWLLYGDDRKNLSAGDMARAALAGYPTMVLLPAGRAVAEVYRASILARRTSAPRAAAAAVLMQAVLLLATSVVSLLCAGAAFVIAGSTTLPLLIAGNALLTGVLGAGILVGGRRSRIGAWLGRRWQRMRSGPEFDEVLIRASTFPVKPLIAASAARLLQSAQLAVLILAVAGRTRIVQTLSAEGVHLVGASVGDLIPAQMGATEAAYTLSAAVLGLAPGAALAIALLTHLTQAAWALIGVFSQLVFATGSTAARTEP
jgi:hypothetical protein